MRRLITPYLVRKEVDRILANLGEDYYADGLELSEGEGDDAAIAEGDQESSDSSGEADKPTGHVDATEAGNGAEIAEFETKGLEIVPLSASQADALTHHPKSQA